jgi:hypothetical protein
VKRTDSEGEPIRGERKINEADQRRPRVAREPDEWNASSHLPPIGTAHLRMLQRQIRHRRQRPLRMSQPFSQGNCDNGRAVHRDDIERRVLAGLNDKLVSPEAVAAAVRAYAEETNRQNHERRPQADVDRRALEKIEQRRQRDHGRH